MAALRLPSYREKLVRITLAVKRKQLDAAAFFTWHEEASHESFYGIWRDTALGRIFEVGDDG